MKRSRRHRDRQHARLHTLSTEKPPSQTVEFDGVVFAIIDRGSAREAVLVGYDSVNDIPGAMSKVIKRARDNLWLPLEWHTKTPSIRKASLNADSKAALAHEWNGVTTIVVNT